MLSLLLLKNSSWGKKFIYNSLSSSLPRPLVPSSPPQGGPKAVMRTDVFTTVERFAGTPDALVVGAGKAGGRAGGWGEAVTAGSVHHLNG